MYVLYVWYKIRGQKYRILYDNNIRIFESPSENPPAYPQATALRQNDAEERAGQPEEPPSPTQDARGPPLLPTWKGKSDKDSGPNVVDRMGCVLPYN